MVIECCNNVFLPRFAPWFQDNFTFCPDSSQSLWLCVDVALCFALKNVCMFDPLCLRWKKEMRIAAAAAADDDDAGPKISFLEYGWDFVGQKFWQNFISDLTSTNTCT